MLNITGQHLSDNVEETYRECLEIIKKKNHDYADASDPFSNFEVVQLLGLNAPEGIQVRILDKLVRISNLLVKPNWVAEEAIEDTLNDTINYFAILKAYLQLRGNPWRQKSEDKKLFQVRVHGADHL